MTVRQRATRSSRYADLDEPSETTPILYMFVAIGKSPRRKRSEGQFGASFKSEKRGAALRLALYQPDIPQNTGTILRLAACFGIPVDVIGPAGFDLSDRSLRRSALDYLDHVTLTRHAGWEAFEAWRALASSSRLVLLTTKGESLLTGFAFESDDILMLGRESAGVPIAVNDAADARVRIPIRQSLRSLNVAVAAAVALGEALRQTGGFTGMK